MDKKVASLWREDSGVQLDDEYEKTTFFDLPAEIRTKIWEHVFDPDQSYQAAFTSRTDLEAPKQLQEDYWASEYLEPLLTCRRFYQDVNLLAFSRTTFAIRNPYTALNIAGRMQSVLRPEQIKSLRNVAVVSEAATFRQMNHWETCVFGVPSLDLDELTIVLHRSSYWHYLFDFNAMMTKLLRELTGTKRIRFVRNQALVKPHFHTWFNRFVNAVLTADRLARFGHSSPCIESTWWNWSFDASDQTATMFAMPAKEAGMDINEYNSFMAPMVEWLRKSIEMEEYDADPMSRNGFV